MQFCLHKRSLSGPMILLSGVGEMNQLHFGPNQFRKFLVRLPLPASGDLLSVFGPDLDSNHFDTLIVFLKEFYFEKKVTARKTTRHACEE